MQSGEVFVGDLIIAELLQGARNDAELQKIETILSFLPVVDLVGATIARQSAANYRFLRSKGITVRKTIDVIIGTYCIELLVPLLHGDRDFDPMEIHLALTVA